MRRSPGPGEPFTPPGEPFTRPGNRSPEPGKRSTRPGERFVGRVRGLFEPRKRFSRPGNRFPRPGHPFLRPGNRFRGRGNAFTRPGNRFLSPGNRFTRPGNRLLGRGKPLLGRKNPLTARGTRCYDLGMPSIQRIIVATDFSDLAEAALDQAMDLARQLGASVTVVHSYEIPIYGFPDGVLVAPAEVAARISGAAQVSLDGIVQRNQSRGVPIKAVLRMGAPWDEINTLAEEEKADMIVIGTHGRRGLTRALLGSVAERVMRTAVRPLLVVHAAKKD